MKGECFDMTLIVGILYRPPSGNMLLFERKFCEILRYYQTSYNGKPLYVCGDFNIILFDEFQCSHTQRFTNLMLSFEFNPLIDHLWTIDQTVISSGILRSKCQ